MPSIQGLIEKTANIFEGKGVFFKDYIKNETNKDEIKKKINISQFEGLFSKDDVLDDLRKLEDIYYAQEMQIPISDRNITTEKYVRLNNLSSICKFMQDEINLNLGGNKRKSVLRRRKISTRKRKTKRKKRRGGR